MGGQTVDREVRADLVSLEEAPDSGQELLEARVVYTTVPVQQLLDTQTEYDRRARRRCVDHWKDTSVLS